MILVINITENFRIDNDDLCYIVQQRFETKKGDVGWRNVTYHSTIANALETIAERETKRKLSSINIDLTELAKELETLRKEFLLEVDKRG